MRLNDFEARVYLLKKLLIGNKLNHSSAVKNYCAGNITAKHTSCDLLIEPFLSTEEELKIALVSSKGEDTNTPRAGVESLQVVDS